MCIHTQGVRDEGSQIIVDGRQAHKFSSVNLFEHLCFSSSIFDVVEPTIKALAAGGTDPPVSLIWSTMDSFFPDLALNNLPVDTVNRFNHECVFILPTRHVYLFFCVLALTLSAPACWIRLVDVFRRICS